MKKIICSLLLLVCIVCWVSATYAYSMSEFKIDLPETFTEEDQDSFKKEDGTNVNVKITEQKKVNKINYSEEELSYLVDQIGVKFEEYKTELKAQLKEQYGNTVSEEKIEEVLKNFSWNIETKEIITATKNNYKCYHITSNMSFADNKYYMEQYSFATSNKTYTLTVSVPKKEDLQSQEIKDIVNSFTIVNYTEPQANKAPKAMYRTITVFVVMILGAIVGAITKKFALKKQAAENAETGKVETETVKSETTEPEVKEPELKETEIKEEIKEEVKEEIKEEIKEEVKEEVKEEIKKEIKEEVKEEIKETEKEEKTEDTDKKE